MREISVTTIQSEVCRLFLEANYHISEDIYTAVTAAQEQEESPVGRTVLGQLQKNYDIARKERMALCQDTGMGLVFAEVGQDVHITGGDFEAAVNAGMVSAYDAGYLRKSVVRDPLFDRSNTNDNSPVILHTKIVPGDRLRLIAVAKGFGSENMSRMKVFVPADMDQIPNFIVETIVNAGPNCCPPFIVGAGIGGTLEKAALMAKEATTRPVGSHNANPQYAALEKQLLTSANNTGIGPAGLGGRTTVLGVNLEYYPGRIASIPVVVNLCCHVSRHSTSIL
ncbi:MAG: fumarate hydratase [Clostridia bacterium]|nr:fumarate hydratase [Clostridia bacterium]